MPVTFDAVGPSATAANSSTSPLTWSHVNAATAKVILNFATSFTGSSNLVTADSYGGNAATLLAFQNSGGAGHSGGGIALYQLTSPPTGSNTESVTFTGAQDTIGASVSAIGSNGLGTAVTNFAVSASSVSVVVNNTTPGGLIVLCACYGGGGGAGVFSGTNSVTVKSAATISTASAADNAVIGIVASAGGNQTVGFSNSAGADNWAIVAVELLPSPGPAPFILPASPAPRPRPGALRGRAARSAGAPYRTTPSPFTPPTSPAPRPRPGAVRGRSASSAGSPYRTTPSPFTPPTAASKGRLGGGRGRALTGLSSTGAPVTVQRHLLVSLASVAGTDDYGNTYPAGVQVGPASNNAQVQLIPGHQGNVAAMTFPMPGRALANVPNVAGGVIANAQDVAMVVSGPALASPADWCQLAFFSNDNVGTQANVNFIYVDSGGTAHTVGLFNGLGFTFPFPVFFNNQCYNPNGTAIFNYSASNLYPLATDPFSGTLWGSNERANYINTTINLVNYIYNVLVQAGIIALCIMPNG